MSRIVDGHHFDFYGLACSRCGMPESLYDQNMQRCQGEPDRSQVTDKPKLRRHNVTWIGRFPQRS